MVFPPRPLLLAAVLTAPSALILPAQSLQLKPTPPPYPPNKSLSSSTGGSTSTTPRPAWSRNGGQGGRGRRQQPLRAYTAAENNKNNNPWLSFLKFPTSFANLATFGYEESLYSFEGGRATEAATKPLMPNLEMEAATITTMEGTAIVTEKDDLRAELNALTKTFKDLQSSMDYKSQLYSETIKSYESMVESLEETNASLELGLNALAVTCDKQEQRLKELQQENGDTIAKEEDDSNNDVSFLLRVQDNVKTLEDDNEMLRCRVRALEVELSDIAFESRHRVMPAAPPAAVVSNPVVTQKAEQSMVPKAPSEPVPQHILQKHEMEHLQLQVEKYKRERSSVRKLFGLGIRRGMGKMGRALNAWSPVHNLVLWGELRGYGTRVV